MSSYQRALWLALALLPACGHAKQVPRASERDVHLRVAYYDRHDSVELALAYGQRTHLEFEPGERVSVIATGDDAAWDIEPRSDAGNHVFIKPVGESPMTNMVIVTDRRTYHFELKLVPRGRHYADVMWVYPEWSRATARRAHVEQKLAEALGTTTAARAGDNTDYWVRGSASIAPSRAWDDGRFTYLVFPRGADLPAILIEEEDGEEALAEKSIDARRNVVMLHYLARRLVLRRGDKLVACIVNRGYRGAGRGAATGTASASVVRTFAGASS